jgi:hypothetical protein
MVYWLSKKSFFYFLYWVDDMFVDDIATYVSLNWLEVSKFLLDIMYPYWWTTHAKNDASEHLESGEMGIGANCVKIGICKKNCRLLAVFNMTLL